MRVIVDYNLCESNARCVQAAPSVFQIDDKEQLQLLIEQPGAELREAVETAAAVCPRQAITIVDEP